MRARKELFARILSKLDIPREAMPGGFGLSMSGQCELTVRGCRRILSYASDCVLLLLGKGRAVSVQGRRLVCTVFEAGCVTVEGHILAITFEEGDAHAKD